MLDSICAHQDMGSFLILLSYVMLEYFIGKSELVKSNSVLEAIFKTVIGIGRLLFRRRK